MRGTSCGYLPMDAATGVTLHREALTECRARSRGERCKLQSLKVVDATIDAP
jgi:hypothetical protein